MYTPNAGKNSSVSTRCWGESLAYIKILDVSGSKFCNRVVLFGSVKFGLVAARIVKAAFLHAQAFWN